MAIKRIHPFEQHVEKIVLGVAVVACAGVLGLQLIGQRSTVTVGKGGPVPLGEAYGSVEAEAKKLAAAMEREDPELPPGRPTGLLAEFTDRHDGPVAPGATLAWAGESGLTIQGREPTATAGSEGPVNVPQVPAVSGVKAAAFLATVDQSEVEAAGEALAKLLPAQQPFDLAAVSVEGTFSGQELGRLLARDPDGEGPIRAIPKNWWDNTTAVVNVELVRERRLPDGTFGEQTIVPSLPGRMSLAEPAQAAKNFSEMQPLALEALAREDDVLRPAWYQAPVVMGRSVGDPWVAPSEASEGDAAPDLTRLIRERQDLRRRIGAAERRLADLRGGGRPLGPAPAGPGRGTGRPPAPANDPNQAAIQRLERQLADLRDRLLEVDNQIRQAGGQPSPDATPTPGTPGGPPDRPGAAPAGPERTTAALLANDSIRLWAHDVTVQRGETYRYTLRVWINNPMLGRANLGEGQEEWGTRPVLVSADAPWSEPVRVDELTYFFITSAQDRGLAGGALGRGAVATAEMYAFSGGYWRSGVVSMEPGDLLAAKLEVPNFTSLLELKPLDAPPPRPGPGGPPGPGLPPPGGGRTAPGGDAPGDRPGDRPGTEAPTRVEVPMVEVPIRRDAFLLDVATTVDSASRGGFQAFLRDLDGTIITRTPEQDRARPEFQRLRQSADRGRAALELIRAGQGGDEPPPAPRPGRDDPQPPPPGGGGGRNAGGG